MTEPKMSREQIKQALKAGQHVAIGGRHITHVRDIPPPPVTVEGEEPRDEFHAVIARGPDGRLTRAGMEHAIRHGGSVMHQGEVLTRIEDLPDEAELVRHDEQQKAALAASIDQQIAALQQQRTALAGNAGEGLGAQTFVPHDASEGSQGHSVGAAHPTAHGTAHGSAHGTAHGKVDPLAESERPEPHSRKKG